MRSRKLHRNVPEIVKSNRHNHYKMKNDYLRQSNMAVENPSFLDGDFELSQLFAGWYLIVGTIIQDEGSYSTTTNILYQVDMMSGDASNTVGVAKARLSDNRHRNHVFLEESSPF